MPGCNLEYIPERLHWNDRPSINQFKVGDIFYRRCTDKELENPYATIRLYDISHNIGTNNMVEISEANDVLYSIKEDEDFEQYLNKTICTLEIKSLNPDNLYFKSFGPIEKDDGNYSATMELVHKPENCMFPHCVFRIIMNGAEITFNNYTETLGVKKLSKLRTIIREELASMIRKRVINQNSEDN